MSKQLLAIPPILLKPFEVKQKWIVLSYGALLTILLTVLAVWAFMAMQQADRDLDTNSLVAGSDRYRKGDNAYIFIPMLAPWVVFIPLAYACAKVFPGVFGPHAKSWKTIETCLVAFLFIGATLLFAPRVLWQESLFPSWQLELGAIWAYLCVIMTGGWARYFGTNK